ncbi:protease pro-enzyme activation domain-containing protein [Nocardioides sp. DS6]|uniref:Protease pro-enzyme activation domain-containing protein n=1 Tax=Nocardioides eburneus TaxID=3231482 RepID=A0ABV3SWP4_9ACTN
MHVTPRARMAAALAATATGLALTAVGAPAHAATHASSTSHRHPLTQSKPRWLSNATSEGAVADGTSLHFSVLLHLRDQSGAESLAQQLSDPSSASYGKWLSTKQFRARFAPTAAQAKAVKSWLTSQGFTVDSTMPSRMLVSAHGSAATVEKVFDTQMRNYRFQGHKVHANATALSLPAATSSSVAGAIEGIVGLDQGSLLKKPADTLPGPPEGARYGVQPCSSYFGQKAATSLPQENGKTQPYAVCGYGPSQLQSAYGVAPLIKKGIDGRGITVAITDAYASPTILKDANTYAATHGQPRFRRGQFSQITPAPDGYGLIDECGGNGWYGEETLDVEAVHALAPGAKVVYVAGADCSTGLDEAWASTIDNHVADVITNSWSDSIDDPDELGQSYIDYYSEYALEAALTGITVSFSSGDSGDHTAGGTNPSAKTAEFPSDVPYVTGVGGTSLEVGKKGQWLGEYGWQSAYAPLDGSQWGAFTYSSGGGGGVSQIFSEPFYQRGVVPTSLSGRGSSAMRVVPDVSLVGDPNTGMEVGETQVFPDGTYYDTYRIGGTSLSSPLFAGVAAVAGQAAGRPIGFANPLLYSLSGSRALHDEVAPRKPVYEVRTDYVNGLDASDGLLYKLQQIDVQTSTLHDVRGYDDETGVGSPNGPTFFAAVAQRLGHGHGGPGGHGHGR